MIVKGVLKKHSLLIMQINIRMNKLEVVRKLKSYAETEKYCCPLTGRIYKCSQFIYFSKSEKYLEDKDLDIAVVVGEKGLTISNNSEIFRKISKELSPQILKGLCVTVTKENSFTWDIEYKDFKYFIKYPKNEKGWKEIIVSLSYLCQLVSFKTSTFLRFYIVQEGINGRQKLFTSFLNKYGVSLANLGYHYIGYPLIKERISKKLNEITKENIKSDGQVLRKLLQYGKSLKDLYMVNLGAETCFINPSRLEQDYVQGLVEGGAIPDRCRTLDDWLVRSYIDKKSLIIYSDLDSYLSIAHELGHYEIDKEDIWGKLQIHSGVVDSLLMNAIQFIFGFGSGAFSKTATSSKLEGVGTIVSMLSRTPVLAFEFIASYRGLKILERIGVSSDVMERAREFFKLAYYSYLAGTLDMGTSITKGRLLGIGMKGLTKKFKK